MPQTNGATHGPSLPEDLWWLTHKRTARQKIKKDIEKDIYIYILVKVNQ